MTIQVLNYGGGRQTVALCVLIDQGKIARPDRIIIADTSRENSSTWEYLDEVTRPMLARLGIQVEIAPRSLAYVDLYSHQGTLLMPVYTATGKLSAYCSAEWKARVVTRYLRTQAITEHINWIGFAFDERKRIKNTDGLRFPLVEAMLTKADCRQIITDARLPMPPPSACWCCPNKGNEEWRNLRDNYPDDFERACQLDEELREEDIANGSTGVWLHHSRVALRVADLDSQDVAEPSRQCGLGLCMV